MSHIPCPPSSPCGRKPERGCATSSARIHNPNTRRAYLEAVRQFSGFCVEIGIVDLGQVEPVHVAAFVETQLKLHSKPTVKQRLVFDWMVVSQVLPVNPAHAVRGPKHTQRRGKTPVLNVIAAIDVTSLPGLRDRALIGLMVYTFARVGAAVSMKVEDFYTQGRRGWIRLHEKGGKEHEMPTHHSLDQYLEEYIAVADVADDRKEPLFRTSNGHGSELAARAMLQSDVWRMIRRRALLAGIKTQIGCHTFRATGITAFLKNGGKLESRSRWPRMNHHGRRGFTIAEMMRFRSTRSSASGLTISRPPVLKMPNTKHGLVHHIIELCFPKR